MGGEETKRKRSGEENEKERTKRNEYKQKHAQI